MTSWRCHPARPGRDDPAAYGVGVAVGDVDDLLDEAAVDGVGEGLGLELRLGASVRGGTAVSFVVTLGLDDGSADVVPLSLGRVDDVPWPGPVG